MNKVQRRRLIYVPVVTTKQLVIIERVVEKLQRVGDQVDEAWRQLEASLTVLNGDNQPEGWKKVRVREAVRQKAKKAI